MRRHKGFSLIEVLVALLLTTVGVLGMVALQSKGIRYTQDAINRNNAASLTNDLIEIMRQYPDEFWEDNYNRLRNTTALFSASGGLLIDEDSCDDDPQNLAEHAGCWVQRMESTLPGGATDAVKGQIKICPSFMLDGNGVIECAGGNFMGSSMGILLAWEVLKGECMDGSDGTVCTYQTRIEL